MNRMLLLLSVLQLLVFAPPAECQVPTSYSNQGREGHIVTPDGVRLYYQIRGSGRDTLMVLHGGPGLSSTYLAPDLHLLERDHALIYYDQRGTGRSTVVTDSIRLQLADHVADVEAVRGHFGLDRLVLIGHSWGAAPLAFYARAHPDRVAKLILVGAIPPRHTPHVRQFGQNLRVWMDSTMQVRVQKLAVARRDTASDPVSACRAYWSVFIRGYFANPADTTVLGRMQGDVCDAPPEALRNRGLVQAAALGSLGEWDWREEFHNVRAPVLIIHGAKDPIPIASAAEWQAAFPDAELVKIEGAGHFPHVEQPMAFQRAVGAFMR